MIAGYNDIEIVDFLGGADAGHLFHVLAGHFENKGF